MSLTSAGRCQFVASFHSICAPDRAVSVVWCGAAPKTHVPCWPNNGAGLKMGGVRSSERVMIMAAARGQHAAVTDRSTVKDRDVRSALHAKVLRDHHGDADTLVLDELGLRHGTCRVDIAVVNGSLHGFEIKSDADTLERLPAQISVYSEVLDFVTLVVGGRHAEKAIAIVPEWWGVKVASVGPRGAVSFDTTRRTRMNPTINPVALAELLWRPEAVEVLREIDAPKAIFRQPRRAMYESIARSVDLDRLRDIVRRRLKARETWRGQRPPASDADLFRPIPKSIDCP